MRTYTDPATAVDLPLVGGDLDDTVKIPDGDLVVARTVLPGGVRLITEYVPGTRSVTTGMWVPVGSVDETPSQGGAAHFLEHLLFKGTKKRSAFEIGAAFDAVGGETNAATSKEATNYWARVLDDDAAMAIETLTDMVTGSVLSDEDVETERTVILDELAMSEDTPAEVAHEAFALSVFGDTALGRPIGGTAQSVQATTAEEIRSLYHQYYQPQRLIVAAAGNVDHQWMKEQLTAALQSSDWNLQKDAAPQLRKAQQERAVRDYDQIVIERDVEQAHVLVGGRWLSSSDPLRPVSTVLMTLLGGGVSSRLFQEVRERRGLAYTTYAFESNYVEDGLFGLYAGCAPENIAEVEKIMWGQVEEIASGNIGSDELHRVKGQLRGSVALGLEDSASRMSRIARSELLGRFVSLNSALSRLEAVEKEDISALAQEMLTSRGAKAMVLPNV